MKTIVYVDGFNLYYGAVKDTPYKWLNILRLCQLLLPKNQIVKIKYFTALVTARPSDPDQPNRQQLFLRALHTIPGLEIIYGHFLEHEVLMPVAKRASVKHKLWTRPATNCVNSRPSSNPYVKVFSLPASSHRG